MKNIILIIIAISTFVSASFAFNLDPRSTEITTFYNGHTHKGEETIGAPSHSGGTNRYGCHNASVPYHCH